MMLKSFCITLAMVIIFATVSGCQEERKDNIELRYTDYKSGKVESETQYVNGQRNGSRKFFDENGKLMSELNFVNGIAEGKIKNYYPDGTLQFSGTYVNGKLDGEVLAFYPDGKLMNKKIYDKGKMLSNTQYTREGKIEYEDKF